MTTIDNAPSKPEQPDQPMLRIPKSAHPVPTPTTRANRRLPVLAYVGGLLALIAVLVVGAQAQGWFGTSGQVSAGSGAGTSERAAPETGASTAEIKGWMTLQQVIDAYPVTREALFAHFSIPADTPMSITLGELSESGTSTFEVTTVRTWIDDGALATP